jgi:hypothetical protein
MLWVGPRLSTMERLSIASFLASGHPVHLYTYERVAGVPPGATLCDAREIVDRCGVFANPAGFGEGSFAAFSDLFRYKLLLDRGGIWCDTDIVCLRPLHFTARMPYAIASERVPPRAGVAPHAVQLNACFVKAPAGSAVMRECYETCVAADKAALRWGDIGPSLATRKFREHGLATHALLPDIVCPVDWWDAKKLVTEPLPAIAHGHALHLWNEMWRNQRLDKDGRHAPASAYETLKQRYLGE